MCAADMLYCVASRARGAKRAQRYKAGRGAQHARLSNKRKACGSCAISVGKSQCDQELEEAECANVRGMPIAKWCKSVVFFGMYSLLIFICCTMSHTTTESMIWYTYNTISYILPRNELRLVLD